MLDELARVARLYDFYGPLLTTKQRRWLELHYHHDLSLGEIADEERISRQAVYDGLQRAVKALEDYEARLGYLQRELTLRKRLTEAISHLENYRRDGCQGELVQVGRILKELLDLPEGCTGKN
ncbi:YlxM family DNA-binding protein [Moorella naiadis]|uniref:YlxM family DNA-binding protein n=1 Tax=Moorella naiadis (nom. illeg.) TaxID=3093670 RepID=UPI003D9CBE2A